MVALKLAFILAFEIALVDFDCDRNLIQDGKNTIVFQPASVFSEEKRKLFGIIPRFWKSARHLIVFVDGAVEALKFARVTKTMNAFWTQKEEKELIKREMKKSLAKHKPMTWAQFIIVLIPVFACLVILLKLALYLGAF